MSPFRSRKYLPAKAETIRDINTTLILNLIRSHQPISRAEVARLTGLQRSTISEIVNELLKKELVIETGAGSSSGGRKPTMMRLNAERFCVFGLSLGVKEVSLAMSDLNGDILYRESFLPEESPEAMFKIVAEKINRIIDARRHERLHYEGIGITIPGLVDYSTGEILFAPNMGWRHLRAEDYLQTRVRMPVYVDNDANAAAMAELWYDTSTDPPSSLVMVLVSEGVGVGMFVNDEIYRGANGTAGEFGHTVVVVNGKKCRCGNSGCWELYASDHATVARYFSRESTQSLHESDAEVETEPLSLSVSDLIKRAQSGDELARESIIEAGRYIGIGIGNIMAALNPLEIVIGGQIIEGWQLIELPMQQSISRNIQHDLSKTIVRPTRLGNDSSLLSAVALAISRRFAFSRVARVASGG